jgi:hypothetical protein
MKIIIKEESKAAGRYHRAVVNDKEFIVTPINVSLFRNPPIYLVSHLFIDREALHEDYLLKTEEKDPWFIRPEELELKEEYRLGKLPLDCLIAGYREPDILQTHIFSIILGHYVDIGVDLVSRVHEPLSVSANITNRWSYNDGRYVRNEDKS